MAQDFIEYIFIDADDVEHFEMVQTRGCEPGQGAGYQVQQFLKMHNAVKAMPLNQYRALSPSMQKGHPNG